MLEKATYSPEDNKLRMYTDGQRVTDDVYQEIKAGGFSWAPVQKLFVAPAWSPEREDLCLKYCGEIECEDITLAERAEAKAARLDALASKRVVQSDLFSAAARRISERMSAGQPILIGHHSERRARKDLQRSESQQRKAIDAAHAASYWLYRAEGVERHVNRKVNPDVRCRRINTLLAELRDVQRDTNHGFICLDFWNDIDAVESPKKERLIEHFTGRHLLTGPSCPTQVWSDLDAKRISHDEALKRCFDYASALAFSERNARRIQHILNRLSYERAELALDWSDDGVWQRYGGEITETIIKAFARENGTHKPDCSKDAEGRFVLHSEAPLPVHLGEGKSLSLSCDEWRDLMFNVGYVVPAKKAGLPPILNFKAASVKCKWHGEKVVRQIELTKAQYSAIHADQRGVKTSSCGDFRIKVCSDPNHKGPYWSADWVCVFITDSKQVPAPDSSSVMTLGTGEVAEDAA